jgi:hypothetical protein
MGETWVNPLTRSDYEQIKSSQRRLTDLAEVVNKLDRCGEECTVFRELIGRTLEALGQFEAEFLTPPPTR